MKKGEGVEERSYNLAISNGYSSEVLTKSNIYRQ